MGEQGRRKLKRNKKINKAGMAAAAILMCMVSFTMFVEAAPATLRSSDATIYDQTNEGSNAIGNLVEGSNFEYVGDVTAEDGSIWHQITTSSGATGYIRGDREIEIGEEEPVTEGQGEENVPKGEPGAEEQNESTGEGGDRASAENEPEEGEERVPEQADGNGEEGANEDTSDEDNQASEEEQEEDGAVEALGHSMENNRSKSYSLELTERVKERDNLALVTDENVVSAKSVNKADKLDKTVILGIAIMLFCGITVYFLERRVKYLILEMGGQKTACESRNRVHKKNDRKNGNRKRRAGERGSVRKGNQKRKK